MTHVPTCRTVAAAVALALLGATSAFADQPSTLKLSVLGSLDLGDVGASEIGAYDARSRQLFVTNAITRTVSIVDARDPASLALVSTIDVASLGSPNSVAVSNGVVAVAIENADKTMPGKVAFYRSNGSFLAAVTVGALPDMLVFTPNGRDLLVANEGEPNGYNNAALYNDPVGSVSIIRVPEETSDYAHLTDAAVRTVSFAAFNGQEAALRQRGIRIYGPGANAAMDFEPEYITVSADSRTAYVTLQENNAIAKINIRAGSVTDLLPLGYKNWNAAPNTQATYEWPAARLPSIGTTPAGQTLRLGGFSGLAYEGVTARGELKFIANTDRGPNGEPDAVTGQRPFLLPGFSPRLVRFTLDPANGRLRLKQQIILRDADGKPLSGLPNTIVAGGTATTPHNDEVAIDLRGNVLSNDALGGDFEGIAVATDGSFWMPDEYRPALYHFDASGKLLARYIPSGAHAAAGLPVPVAGVAGALGIEALPAVLGQRRQNRGMEGIALKDGKVYGFVQSPIRNPANLSNGALNALRNIRIVELDPATLATRQFLYVMDNPASTGAADTRADKIGDAVATPTGFLVMERDDDALPQDPLATITKKIYATSLTGATDITGRDGLHDVGAGVMKSLDQMSAAELALPAINVKPVAKTLHVDLAAAGYANVEKAEGLALLADGRLAVVNDNDFQVAQIALDMTSGTFTLLPGYEPESVTVGLISVPGLDASDREISSSQGAINIRNWPVLGMYEPDAIASYKVNGVEYLITANEGDTRADWPGYNEEARISTLTLDPTLFPNAAALKANGSLGRLKVTNSQGDLDGDGDYDALFTIGGRSFSIRTTDGQLVFDSEAALERLTSMANPARFNAGHDDPTFDSRSDDKGPEPEGVAVGRVGNRTYAFIGLERMGGVVAYDVTNPAAPVLVDFLNPRGFTVPQTGDLGPEGVLFIAAEKSPTQQPLLVVTNEISGTVTTYSLGVSDDEDEDGGDHDD